MSHCNNRRFVLLIAAVAFIAIGSECYAGPFRRFQRRHNSCCANPSGVDTRTCVGSVCPVFDYAHHTGYCSYYAQKCKQGTQFDSVNWEGGHGHTTNNCSSCTGCEAAWYHDRNHHVSDPLHNGGMAGTKPKKADLDLNDKDPNWTVKADKKGQLIKFKRSAATGFISVQIWDVTVTPPAGSGDKLTFHIGHEIDEDVTTIAQQGTVVGAPDVAKHSFAVTHNGEEYIIITHHSTK